MSKQTFNSFIMEFVPTDDDFDGEEEYESGRLFSRHSGSAVGTDEGRFISSSPMGKGSLSARLRKALAGKFGGEHATLILFDFTFDAPPNHRFKHASIDIDFESVAVKNKPELKRWCPDHVLGDDSSTVYSRSSSSSFSAGRSSLGSVSIGTNNSVERLGITRFHWTANPKGDLRTGKYHGITWRLSENENNREGIPHTVTVALMLRNYGTFNARIWADAKLSTGLNLAYLRTMSTKTQTVPIYTTQDVGEKIDNLQYMHTISLEKLVDLPFV